MTDARTERLTAAAMRHVIAQVGQIAKDALACEPTPPAAQSPASATPPASRRP
jgi:hypothetical protein